MSLPGSVIDWEQWGEPGLNGKAKVDFRVQQLGPQSVTLSVVGTLQDIVS